MKSDNNIYHIVQGQSGTTSWSLMWKVQNAQNKTQNAYWLFFLMKSDVQCTTICYNAQNLQRKTVFEIDIFFEIVCTILLNVHLKNKLLIWTQQGLIYYIYCKESLEYITMQRFLSGSTYFLTGTVLMIGGFAYTLTL